MYEDWRHLAKEAHDNRITREEWIEYQEEFNQIPHYILSRGDWWEREE